MPVNGYKIFNINFVINYLYSIMQLDYAWQYIVFDNTRLAYYQQFDRDYSINCHLLYWETLTLKINNLSSLRNMTMAMKKWIILERWNLEIIVQLRHVHHFIRNRFRSALSRNIHHPYVEKYRWAFELG